MMNLVTIGARKIGRNGAGFWGKGAMAMKGVKLLGLAILGFGLLFSGCTVEEADSCCYDPGRPAGSAWFVMGSDWLDLSVGGGCGSGYYIGCGWYQESLAWDTIFLSGWDKDLVDLQFNYTLTNWGNVSTRVWVTLCDYLGCEDVIYTDLDPGEVIWARVPNPVLDTALADFYDCLYYYGDFCYLEYDIDVYLGQECACSPVTLHYYYEGLFVY